MADTSDLTTVSSELNVTQDGVTTTVYGETTSDDVELTSTISVDDSTEASTATEVVDNLSAYSFADEITGDDLSGIMATSDDITEEGYVMTAAQASSISDSIDDEEDTDSTTAAILYVLQSNAKGVSSVYKAWELTCDDSVFVAKLHDDGTLTIDGEGAISLDTETQNTELWNNSENEVKCLRAIIGPNITTVGDYMFNGCSELMSVVIPDGVTEIGQYCCHGTNLLSIDLPDSITTIGEYAFV